MARRFLAHVRQQWIGVVALALVLAGGTAYATHPGGANTISSGDIMNGEVKSDDIGLNSIGSAKITDKQVKNQDLSLGASSSNTIADLGIQNVDVANNTLTGAKVNDDSLTGGDIDEESLNLGAEHWQEIGAAGEPAFITSVFCTWKNFDPGYNSAAFLRDRDGFVHLKGTVDAEDVAPNNCDFSFAEDRRIFALPAGYRPALREIHATLTNDELGRVSIDGPGTFVPEGSVSVDAPTTLANGKAWVSLDGITFRCAPSGIDGCP